MYTLATEFIYIYTHIYNTLYRHLGYIDVNMAAYREAKQTK